MEAQVQNPQHPLPPQQQHLLNLTAAPKRTASGSIRTRTASASSIPTGSHLHPPTLGTPLGTLQDPGILVASMMPHIPPEAAPHIHALRRFDLDLVVNWLHIDRQLAMNASQPEIPIGQYPTFPRHFGRQPIASSIRSSSMSGLFTPAPTSGSGPGPDHPSFNAFPDPNASPFRVAPDGQPSWGFDGMVQNSVGMPGNLPFTKPGPTMGTQQPFIGIQRATVRNPTSARGDQEKKQRYVCTSCEVRFTRRWDWKHHEETVHERWRKFPCPDCNQEFWSENSFNQHHKSAHNCKNCPHASTVKKDLLKRAAWGCGFCAAVHYSWDDRCKHVASHFDKGQTKDDWKHSNVIYGLLHQPDLLDAWRTLLIEKHGQYPDPRPCFSWKSKTTGRQQGVRDGSAITQLQDLLEYARTTQEVSDIIQKAYDLGSLESVPTSYKLERRDSSFPLELANSPPPTPVAIATATAASDSKFQNGGPPGQAFQASSIGAPAGMSMSPNLQNIGQSFGYGNSRPMSLPMMAKTNSGAGSDSGVSAITLSASGLITDQFESFDSDGIVGSQHVTPRQGMVDPIMNHDPLNMFYPSGAHPNMQFMGGSGDSGEFDFGAVSSAGFLGTPVFAHNSLGVTHQNLSSLSLPASLEHHSNWQHTPPSSNPDPSLFHYSHSPAFAPGVESLLSLEKELPVLDAYGMIASSGAGGSSRLANNVSGMGDEWMSTVSASNFSSSPHSMDGKLGSSIG